MTSTSGASCSREPVLPGALRERDRHLRRRRRQRQCGRGADARHAGNRRQRAFDAILKPHQVWRLRKEFGRAPDAEGEQAFWIESWIRPEQVLDAAHHEPSTAEEHERERDLRDDHPATHAAVAAAAPHAAAGEQRRQRGACPPDRGHRRGEEPEQHAERGHPADNFPVHRDRLAARKVQRRQRDERARRPDGHQCARTRRRSRPSRPPSNSVARMTARSLAPSARDTANSCSRCAARASSTDARLTINMSARSAPAAPRTKSAGRALATTSALRPTG